MIYGCQSAWLCTEKKKVRHLAQTRVSKSRLGSKPSLKATGQIQTTKCKRSGGLGENGSSLNSWIQKKVLKMCFCTTSPPWPPSLLSSFILVLDNKRTDHRVTLSQCPAYDWPVRVRRWESVCLRTAYVGFVPSHFFSFCVSNPW